jgi:DNA polymerase-3 subunit gamma/tau
VIRHVQFSTADGGKKIVVLSEADRLTPEATNAFLKTLEEPPKYAIFILATTEKHKIIPTILSRCQIFDFNRIQVKDMADHLRHICEQEHIQPEEDALHIIAQKADGALRDALSIFDRVVSFTGDKLTYQGVIDNLNILDYDYYFRITDACLTEDTATLMNLFDQILYKGFDVEVFLSGFSMHLRNLLVCKDPNTHSLLELSGNVRLRYAQQAQLSPKAFLLTALSLLNDCDIHYKMARNKRLHIEIYLLKIAYINRMTRLQNIPAAHAANEKKNPEPHINSPQPQQTSPHNPNPDTPPAKNQRPSLSELRKTSLLDQAAQSAQKDLDQQRQQAANALAWTPENVQKLWDEHTAAIPSAFIRRHYAESKLRIEPDNKKALFISVPDLIAQDEISRAGKLTHDLRSAFHAPELQIQIQVLAPTPAATNPALPANLQQMSLKDKLQLAEKMLTEENPLLQEFKERFGLDFKNK